MTTDTFDGFSPLLQVRLHAENMNLGNPLVHEIDTRQNTTLTVFDGSREDESKLAQQFWNSVLLMPPVESTLVCKEIHQRTKSRPLHESADPTKLTASMIKARQEKALRDKEFEDVAVMKAAADQSKRIEAIRQRHEHLRQLFYKQARTNRLKHQEWAIPHIHGYSMNRTARESMDYYRDELYKDVRQDDDYDRQLVRLLPD